MNWYLNLSHLYCMQLIVSYKVYKSQWLLAVVAKNYKMSRV